MLRFALPMAIISLLGGCEAMLVTKPIGAKPQPKIKTVAERPTNTGAETGATQSKQRRNTSTGFDKATTPAERAREQRADFPEQVPPELSVPIASVAADPRALNHPVRNVDPATSTLEGRTTSPEHAVPIAPAPVVNSVGEAPSVPSDSATIVERATSTRGEQTNLPEQAKPPRLSSNSVTSVEPTTTTEEQMRPLKKVQSTSALEPAALTVKKQASPPEEAAAPAGPLLAATPIGRPPVLPLTPILPGPAPMSASTLIKAPDESANKSLADHVGTDCDCSGIFCPKPIELCSQLWSPTPKLP